jgi:endonuclease/exonuclease/phosphatase family metal-dependent hydrolase
MSYNVRYFAQPTKGLTTTERAMRGIVEALCALDPMPSVITLQEVESHSLRANLGRRHQKPQLERMLDTLNHWLEMGGRKERFEGRYFPSHRYSVGRSPSLYTTGLAMLVSDEWQIEGSEGSMDVTHRRISMLRRLKQTRICAHLHLRHRHSGAELELFNTHLSLPQFLSWSSIKYPSRMGYAPNQLLEIFNVLDFIASFPLSPNVILTGDFNSLPGSPVYEQVLSSGLFIDALDSLHSFDTDAYRASPSAGFMSLRMHLDYVFSSPNIEWLDFDHTHPHDRSHAFTGLSDHSPIIGRALLASSEERGARNEEPGAGESLRSKP